jgi:hypothetical protein
MKNMIARINNRILLPVTMHAMPPFIMPLGARPMGDWAAPPPRGKVISMRNMVSKGWQN